MAQECTLQLFGYFEYEDLSKAYEDCLKVLDDNIEPVYNDRIDNLHFSVENAVRDLIVTYYNDRDEDVTDIMQDWFTNGIVPYIKNYYENVEGVSFNVLSINPIEEYPNEEAKTIKDIEKFQDEDKKYYCGFIFDTDANVTRQDMVELIGDCEGADEAQTEDIYHLQWEYDFIYGCDKNTITLTEV